MGSGLLVHTSPVDSDHRLLLVRIRSRFAAPTPPAPARPDYSVLGEKSSAARQEFVERLKGCRDYAQFASMCAELCDKLPRKRRFALDPAWLAMAEMEGAPVQDKEAAVSCRGSLRGQHHDELC